MLVSAILCTRNCRHFLPAAIASYLSQDWEEKELIVVDTGTDKVADLFENIPNVNYIAIDDYNLNLSAKRNLAARTARGEVLIHFDSDDWSASTRIKHQVEALKSIEGAQLAGYHTAFFWDEIDKVASCYNGQHNYSWGPCLCYRREFALANPWPEYISNAEDNAFVKVAQDRKQIVSVDGSGQIVVRLHRDNARRKAGTCDWPFIPTEKLPAQFRSVANTLEAIK